MHGNAGDIGGAPARRRLQDGLRRALDGAELLFDRDGRAKAAPWLAITAGVPAWRVLTLLPEVLAEAAADGVTAPRLAVCGLEGMDDVLARGVAAAKVASLLTALERERRGAQGDVVARLQHELARLRRDNERLRHAVDALAGVAFAAAEAREAGGAIKALPPPDPEAVLTVDVSGLRVADKAVASGRS